MPGQYPPSDKLRVTVTNAGTHPEPAQMAAAWADTEAEVHYWTSLSWAPGGLVHRISLLDAKLPRLLRRRILPSPLETHQVHRRGAILEALYQLFAPHNRTLASRTLTLRSRTFENATSRSVDLSSQHIVIAQHRNALNIFKRAGEGTLRVLNYPLPHHRWLDTEMKTEAHLNPEWAPYLQHHNEPEGLLGRFDQEVELADYVLVASSFSARTFVEQGISREKLLVVPLGTSHDPLLSQVAPTQSTPPPNTLRLLFVGQITQRKGIGYLLEALQLARLTSNVELTLVGKSVNDAHLRLRNIPGIALLPHVPRTQLARIYADHDFLVLPSLADGYGLVCIEAMAAGTPIIASERSLAPDLVSEGLDGYVINVRDVQALSQRLSQLAGDLPRVRGEMRVAAAETSRKYTWQAYREEIRHSIMKAAVARAVIQ